MDAQHGRCEIRYGKEEDYWLYTARRKDAPIQPDNHKAYDWICTKPINLVHWKNETRTTLRDLKNTVVVFVTNWEPLSATKFGMVTRAMARGEKQKYCWVFFEATRDELFSWNSQRPAPLEPCYLLDDPSKEFAELVGRIPIEIKVGTAGVIEYIREGITTP